MKKTLFAGLFLLVFASSFAWSAERIRIGYSSISGSYMGLWIAHDAGFFAREGLDDQMILIPSGSQLAQVATAGEIDLAALNGSSAMAAALQGADLKVIGNTHQQVDFFHLRKAGDQDRRGAQGKKDRRDALWVRH